VVVVAAAVVVAVVIVVVVSCILYYTVLNCTVLLSIVVVLVVVVVVVVAVPCTVQRSTELKCSAFSDGVQELVSSAAMPMYTARWKGVVGHRRSPRRHRGPSTPHRRPLRPRGSA